MEDSFNFDDSEIKKINLPKKEDQKKDGFLTKINNSYKDFMRKIKLGFIVDKIDKYFPSLILFIVLFLIVIGIILFFVFYSPMQEYKLDVYVNNKLVNTRLSFSENIDIVNNTFKYYPDKYLNLKIIYNSELFEERIKTDKSNIRVDLEITPMTNRVVDKTFSFSLESNSGLLSKNGVIKLECDNYSQEFNIVNGILQNIIVPCDAVKANVSVEGLPTVNQTCGSGLCKIKLNDPVSSPSIEQNLSKNKLLVYVNNLDSTPAKGIEVSVRENSTTQTLIDKGLTKDHGNYVFELLEGEYIITINDLENKYAVQTKNITITAGASITEYFVLDLPNIGTINLSFDVEDNNYISGFVYLNDINNKIIAQKEFDSNINLEFGIKAMGKYKLSAQLNSSYSNTYVAVDKEFDFTETKNLTMNIRKFNSFTDQRLVLQVLDSTTQKPIPNITVFFEEYKGSLSSTYMQNIGELKTDYNGMIKQIFPKGNYIAKIKHPYFSETPTSFNITETKSLTMTDVPLKITVTWGNTLINMCLYETINSKKEDLIDAFIEVYTSNNEFVDSYYLNEDNCADLSVKLLENVYFKITKIGYRELYTQDFFVNNTNKLDLEFELVKSVTTNKLSNINYDFLGAFSDVALKTKVSKLGYGDYYFGFKVKVPKHLVNLENKLYFYGVAGDRIDENYLDSKLIVRNVYGLGNEIIYSNYFSNFFKSDNKIASTLNEDKYYVGKSFSNIFNFASAEDDLELYYVVKATVTDNTKMNDKIKLHYNFNLNDYSDFKTITLTFGEECSNDLCVELYDQGTLLSSNLALNNYGALTAKVEYNYDYKSKFAFYNLGLKENDSKLENLKSNDLVISNGNLYLEGFSENKNINLNNGPIYVSDLDILKTNYLEIDFNYNLATESKTKLNFSIYDNFAEKISRTFNVDSVNADELEVIFDTEYLVPFIENELIIYVNANNNPINFGEAKYYYYSNGQWILGDVENIFLGQVILNLKPLAINDEVKIIFDVPNYKIKEIVKKVNFDFLSFGDIYLEASVNQNNTELPVSEIINKSKYDVNVYAGKYMPTNDTMLSLYNDLLNIPTMEKFFGTNDSLIKSNGENGKLELKVAFDKDYFMNLKLDRVSMPLIFSFYYLPNSAYAELYGNNLDLKYNKTVNLDLDIKLEGSIEKNCLILDLENSNGESFFSSESSNKLTYLEENNKTIYAVITNTCKLDGYDFELRDLNLIISNDAIPLTANVYYNEMPINSLTGVKLNVPLSEARKSSEATNYRYKLDLGISDFDAIKNSLFNDKKVSFELNADYILNGLEVGNNNNLKKDLFLNFKTFEDCVYFGLPKNILESQLDSDNPDYCVAGTNCEVLRLPYYLKGERDINPQIKVINDEINETIAGYAGSTLYEIDSIPLTIINDCNKKLEFYLTTNNSDLKIRDTSVLPNSNLNFSLEETESKNMFLDRGSSFSGGVIIDLNLISENYSTKLNSLKVNVESSKNKKQFELNPFENTFINNFGQVKSLYYDNDFYLTSLDSDYYSDAFGFDNIKETLGIERTKFAIYNGGRCTFFSGYYGTIITGALSYYPQQYCIYTYNDYKYEDYIDYYLPRDYAVIDYSYNHKQGETDQSGDGHYNVDSDESSGFLYYFPGISKITDLFKDDLFIDSLNSTSIKEGFLNNGVPKQYSLIVNAIQTKFDNVEQTNKLDLPIYFENIGFAWYGGDGDGGGTVKAMTFCPSQYNLEKIIIDKKSYSTNGMDEGFEEILLDNGARMYLYGGKVDLKLKYHVTFNDEFGIYKMGAKCRLKEDKFTTIIPRKYSESMRMAYNDINYPLFVGFEEYNCINNGITGNNVVPLMNDDFSNVNCQEDYCNMVQASNYIINLYNSNYKNSKNFTIKQLNLLTDNYSKDVFYYYKKPQFLGSYSDYNVFYNAKLNLNILATGQYYANISVVNEKNLNVDLFYQTYTLPDHLFYYMPYIGDILPGNNLGTSFNTILNYSTNKPYPLFNGDVVPLFNYTLTTDLKSISGDLPIVLQGFVNFTENQGTGQITFDPNSYHILPFDNVNCPDFECTLNIANNSYSHIWVKYNNNVYDGDLYFNIDKTDTTLKLSKKYDVIPFSKYNVYLITVNKSQSTINTLEDIFNNIEQSYICYTKNNNTYTYYWNIPKLLESY